MLIYNKFANLRLFLFSDCLGSLDLDGLFLLTFRLLLACLKACISVSTPVGFACASLLVLGGTT